MRNARKVTRRRGVTAVLPAALLVLLAAVFAAGCGSSSSDSTGSSSSGGAKLDVVGYSTPESVYAETLEPAFEKTSEGKGVSFSNSFGASGDQSRAVVAGQPASVVHFSQAGDMERLVEEGELVSKDWEKQPYGGIATGLGRRDRGPQGQPATGIKSLEDLADQGRRRRHPEPVQLRLGPLEHHGRLRRCARTRANRPTRRWKRSRRVLEKTSRPAGQRPRRVRRLQPGRGRRPAQLRERSDQGRKGRRRRRIRHPALDDPDRNPDRGHQEARRSPPREDFLKFLWSDEGQELWAENGYRPVNPKLVDPKQFPTPKDLFKISKFGGWGKVNDEFFDEETGSVAKIEGELGVSTSG